MKFRIFNILSCIVLLGGCGGPDRQTFQGYVEGENIYLASPFSGALVDVLVERGQKVRAGELLFKLDPDPQQIVMKEALAGLQQSMLVYEDLKKPKRPEEIAAIEAQIG